ncbi:SAM-dependent methyltransferase [Candidatus Woesearchaeota archaeon]|nr:SAM-dependent methyltransferase [Candidatus Woesearchaeota archaeon]
MIISHYEAEQLLEAKKKGLKSTDISLDLNLSRASVKIENDFFIFPDNQKLDEAQLKKIIKNDTSCFLIKDNSILKIQLFSEQTNKFYKLVPTKNAPTIEISGIRMHVTKEMTPMEDTKKKIGSIMPIKGVVLDTCMGLGYTAILASKYADFVFTCERDENVLEIAQLNPWSRELFNSKKISVLKAGIFNEIKIFKNNMFDAVIHDPPRLSLATELYSLDFYKQIFRALKKNSNIYHYTGSPGSKNRKINLAKNVAERLKTAGFKGIKRAHYGLTARK